MKELKEFQAAVIKRLKSTIYKDLKNKVEISLDNDGALVFRTLIYKEDSTYEYELHHTESTLERRLLRLDFELKMKATESN